MIISLLGLMVATAIMVLHTAANPPRKLTPVPVRVKR